MVNKEKIKKNLQSRIKTTIETMEFLANINNQLEKYSFELKEQ